MSHYVHAHAVTQAKRARDTVRAAGWNGLVTVTLHDGTELSGRVRWWGVIRFGISENGTSRPISYADVEDIRTTTKLTPASRK